VTEATAAPDERPVEEQDEPQPYVVRLLATVPAHSPEEAVLGFIEQLTANGLRNWVYGVLDAETGETVAELNGYAQDQSELIERLSAEQEAAERDREPDDDEPEPDEAATPDSDEELTRLAEGLNAGQQ